MQPVSPNDFSNAAFPFGTAREIEIGMGLARAHRVTYVGELGWELYVPTDQAAHVFETIERAGAAHGLKLCGLHALDSCRIEKAFRHFGHDITDEDHVLEAGLGFAVKTGKGDFLGREAVLRRAGGRADPAAGPVPPRRSGAASLPQRGDRARRQHRRHRDLRQLRSRLGGAVGLGYVPCRGETEAELLASSYEIEIAGQRFAAEASLKPLYDPKSERVRQ